MIQEATLQPERAGGADRGRVFFLMGPIHKGMVTGEVLGGMN